jgi:indolepyruvate ferredoxin oxidoreductase
MVRTDPESPRRLVGDYIATADSLVAQYSAAEAACTREIAGLPDLIGGYEHIKLANVARYENELRRLLGAASTAQSKDI